RSWTFEGGTPGTASGQEVIVYYHDAGTFDVTLEVENSGGESIIETFENTVKVWPGVGVPLTYTENFEDTEDLDEKWSVINTGTTHPWIIYDEVSGASGDHALMLPNRSLSAGDVSEIWSQPIDLSDTTAEITMTFKYAYARRNLGNNERLMLWVSGNCGESWSLKGIWNNDFETVSYTNSYWIPSSPSHWETVTI